MRYTVNLIRSGVCFAFGTSFLLLTILILTTRRSRFTNINNMSSVLTWLRQISALVCGTGGLIFCFLAVHFLIRAISDYWRRTPAEVPSSPIWHSTQRPLIHFSESPYHLTPDYERTDVFI